MKSRVSNVYSDVRRCVATVIAFFAVMVVSADDDVATLRPVTAAYMIEAGSAHLADTYLTPLKYEGQHFALAYERLQAMRFSSENWAMQLDGRLGLNHVTNPARNATMWDMALELRWGMMHRWRTGDVKGLQFWAGASTGVNIGALYLARNGNNPMSAKAAWTVNLTGAIVYNLRLSKLPVCLRYQPVLPVAGVFFSPDYGELYYEIYLGNHKNLVHGAWWGNYFRIDNLLTADLRFGATNLRLGYRADVFSSKVNNIVSRSCTHSFVLGVSGEWMSLPRSGKISEKAKIISAMY